ncbi:MAG: tetratricopeptide repeat protein [Gallionellaceae bacterium]|jgi:Flp pilus assembly protein TadD|nr:tetratricopeptide repeat protein [Gallionellaceae bacterium]
MFTHFPKTAALLASLFLCFAASAQAGEIQEIDALLKQGQADEALQRIDAYLADKPKDAQGRFEKGLILTQQGKADEAIRIFSDLTEDYPELPEPYNNLAVLYAGKGQYKNARDALEMSVRTHPDYLTAHENLGDVYVKLASGAYERAAQLNPDDKNTQTKLKLLKELLSAPTE